MPNYGSVIDGSNVGYGTQLITFTTAGAGWTAENFTVNRPVQTARDRKTTGEPKNSRYTVDFIDGSMTLQAPSGASGWPAFGDTFTITVDDNYGAETFIVMPVPYTTTNDAGVLRKIEMSFAKKNTNTLTQIAPAAA